MKTRLKENIGLIGCGNMGSAIVEGVLRRGLVRSSCIYGFDPDRKKLAQAKKVFRLRACRSNQEVARHVQILLLAFKPQELKKVAAEFSALPSALPKNRLIISILAGTPIAKIKRAFGRSCRVVRAMPNLGAKVGFSMTALAGEKRGMEVAESIFACCGETLRVSERYFDLVTAVSGSGPAYFFLLMEILAEFAKQRGLSDAQANLLTIQTAVGAGELARMSKDLPAELRKRVSSKGGTTEAALSVLLKGKFHKLFCRALQKAVTRAGEISRLP